ncbi:MAG: thermonuclease family protein [Bauldia sp.]
MRTLIGALVAILLAAAIPGWTNEPPPQMCFPGQRYTPDKTCIVDGDTPWLSGENIRLEGFDTPEPQTAICGGAFEVELAHRSSARLLELLNGNIWTIERFGFDPNGRRLATIRIRGINVGDILIAERLARSWPYGNEWWCR